MDNAGQKYADNSGIFLRKGATLRMLLDYLAAGERPEREEWQGWRIERIGGGTNALLYHAAGPAGDLAVKFTPRDARDRAGREFAALSVLRRAGLALAPEPILLDRERYPLPVVVQSWVQGEPLSAPPGDDAAWLKLLEHYAAIHTVTPAGSGARLAPAVLTADSAAACRELMRAQIALLPSEHRPKELQALVRRWEEAPLPNWPSAPVTLVRCDANYRNLIRRPAPNQAPLTETGMRLSRPSGDTQSYKSGAPDFAPGAWASVDWENGGWGDPAFEIAELAAHAAYASVPDSHWDWVIAGYLGLAGDRRMMQRISVYRRTLLVWWAVRLARYLYEAPHGLDRRLVERPAGWEVDLRAKYEHYMQAATAQLDAPLEG